MSASYRSSTVPEIVVISGKGGTGKTSLVASFATLADGAVLADCDVDAADLFLLLSPRVLRSEDFYSGRVAAIRNDSCIACGECIEYCRFDAISSNGACAGADLFCVDSIACEGCGVCVHFCPQEAIEFPERNCGRWFISETRAGPMVHAKLGIAAGNSGKLVSTVRNEAQQVARDEAKRLIIVDGPPGVGCPVIASVTGASLVLVVTEPTVSGEHDLDRVLELTKHFAIPTAVCLNKWDVNPELADRIEMRATEAGASLAGRVRYDEQVTSAQLELMTPAEIDGGISGDVGAVWETLRDVATAHGIPL